MECPRDPGVHVDEHALLSGHGVVAFLDALADPVLERRPDDGGADITDPRLRNLDKFFAIWQEGQDIRELLKEGIDELQR